VELGFKEFGDSLAQFLRDYTRIEVYGSDFEGDGFEGHQLCIDWCKVSSFLPSLIALSFDLIAGLPSLFVQGFISLSRNRCPEDRNLPCVTEVARLRIAT
jgi:hypothetical protein